MLLDFALYALQYALSMLNVLPERYYIQQTLEEKQN